MLSNVHNEQQQSTILTHQRDSTPKLFPKDNYNHLAFINDNIRLLKLVNDPTLIIQNQTEWINCLQHTDFYKMYLDPTCLYLWMHKLNWEGVQSIDRVIGVAPFNSTPSREYIGTYENGGLRTYLGDNITNGYWKPCTLETKHEESYLSEINAFWVDRFLGFFHTPPAVPRFFSREQLLELSAECGDPYSEDKLYSVMKFCGSPHENETLGIESDGAEGAHIGWSPFELIDLNSKKKREKFFVTFRSITTNEELEIIKQEWFNVTSASSEQERRISMEIICFHMFAVLTGNLHKTDHNLFKAIGKDNESKYAGPFVYIDNDRSQWLYRVARLENFGSQEVNPLKSICKFPKKISEKILLLRTGNPNNNGQTLGDSIMRISEVYRDTLRNAPLFTESEKEIMNANIDFLSWMIDMCVKEHGAEYVFVEEPWPGPEDYPPLAILFQ